MKKRRVEYFKLKVVRFVRGVEDIRRTLLEGSIVTFKASFRDVIEGIVLGINREGIN